MKTLLKFIVLDENGSEMEYVAERHEGLVELKNVYKEEGGEISIKAEDMLMMLVKLGFLPGLVDHLVKD